MFRRFFGKEGEHAPSERENEKLLSRRQMLGVTGMFVLAAPVMLRPSEAVAGIIRPAPVVPDTEPEFTQTPYKPDEDDAEIIDISRGRRRRSRRRRSHRRRGRRFTGRHRRRYGHYGRHRHRRRYYRSGPDFCLWGPWGGFCVD